jgi:hypothetical protein
VSPKDNQPQPNRENTSSPGRRSRRALPAAIATSLAVTGLAVPPPAASAATTFTQPTANVGIIPLPADVYTISANGTLIPILPLSTPLSAPLYNLAGNALDLTWGQFSSATTKSYAWTVTRNGTTYTQLLITMSGLVPHGVYSLFYRTFGPDSNNALCPNVEPTVALTAAFPQFQKPDSDSFIASSSGKGLFFASVPEDLLAAQQLRIHVIYDFNGQTYGPVANQAESLGTDPTTGLCRSSYGDGAMRQFLIIQK